MQCVARDISLNAPFRYQGPLIVGASEISRQDASIIPNPLGLGVACLDRVL